MSPSALRSLTLSTLYALSTSLHPLLLKSILSTFSFSHAAALALLQLLSIAISLWFWTIFGLYKARSHLFLSRHILPLALLRAIRTLVAIHALERTSLPAFAAATLTIPALTRPPPTPLYIAAPILTLIGALCTILSEPPTSTHVLLPVHIVLGCLQAAMRPWTEHVKGSELQIQLVVTSLAAVALIPAVLVEELVFRHVSLATFVYDEVVVVCIFSTGLLAFWRFVVARAAVYRLSDSMALASLHLAWLLVFVWGAKEDDSGWLVVAAAAMLAVGGVLKVAAVEGDVEDTLDAVV